MAKLSLIIDASRARSGARDFERATGRIKRSASSTTQFLKRTALGIGAFFALREVVQRITEFEAGLVAVGKTTNTTGDALQRLGRELQIVAATGVTSTTNILSIAEAAGQLGVASQDVAKFTETIAKLEISTDLVGADAAKQLARLLTITGEGVDNIDRLGASIVSLGNDFATSESEIVALTANIAQNTAGFGLAGKDIVALSTALKSVGAPTEVAGTAIGRVLDKITEISGTTEDSIGQFQAFIEELGKLKRSDAVQLLNDMGLASTRVRKAVIPLATAQGLLNKTLEQGRREYELNAALNKEAAEQMKTLESAFTRLSNNFTSFLTQQSSVADVLRTVIEDVAVALQLAAGLPIEDATERSIALSKGLVILADTVSFLADAIAFAGDFLERLIRLMKEFGRIAPSGLNFLTSGTFSGGGEVEAKLGAIQEKLDQAVTASRDATQRDRLQSIRNQLDAFDTSTDPLGKQLGGLRETGKGTLEFFEELTARQLFAAQAGDTLSDSMTRLLFNFKDAGDILKNFIQQLGELAAQRLVFDQLGGIFAGALGGGDSGGQSGFAARFIGNRQPGTGGSSSGFSSRFLSQRQSAQDARSQVRGR